MNNMKNMDIILSQLIVQFQLMKIIRPEKNICFTEHLQKNIIEMLNWQLMSPLHRSIPHSYVVYTGGLHRYKVH